MNLQKRWPINNPNPCLSTLLFEMQRVFHPDGILTYIGKCEGLFELINSIIRLILICTLRTIRSFFFFFQYSFYLVSSFNVWKRSPFIHDIRRPIPFLWTYTKFRPFESDFDYNQLRISLPGPRLSRIFEIKLIFYYYLVPLLYHRSGSFITPSCVLIICRSIFVFIV